MLISVNNHPVCYLRLAYEMWNYVQLYRIPYIIKTIDWWWVVSQVMCSMVCGALIIVDWVFWKKK